MLQVRRLEKVIGASSVLQIEQFDLAPGEVVAVVGPMGSGKTLLLRVLAGLLQTSGGTVMLDEQDIYSFPAVRARIGILFEDDLLYERHSVRGNLELYRRMHGLPKNRIIETLTLLGLNDQVEKAAIKLSSSAQRRLAFARLWIWQPAVFLLDQPILRTDLDTQALFARLISQSAQNGAAVLLTAEDLDWAGKFCTRVVELEDGRITNSYSPGINQTSATPERFIPYKVPGRKEDRITLFDPGDLLYATSRDGKTFLRTASEESITNLTLQELEGRLQGRGFFKAHRAYLVNLQHIKAVVQYTRNSYTLLLNDQQETMIPLSKQYEKELQELLGY